LGALQNSKICYNSVMNQTTNGHYVYAYVSKRGTVYYIGKGKGNRAWQRHKGCNACPPKDNSHIVIMEDNLTEIGALALERRYIRWYGRKDLGTGILRNLTDGGDGVSGIIRSEEVRKRMSDAQTGEKHHFYGKQHNPETIEKLRNAKIGKKRTPFSEEHKRKIKESHSGSRNPMFGRKHSPETIEKIRNARLSKTKENDHD
jgi:NUMOD3 motif